MKAIALLALSFLVFGPRGQAQTASFADTLDLLARTWKLTAAEGIKDTAIHIELLKGRTLKFRKDFTYTSMQGDSIVERGIWAIDRERKWLLSMPEKQPTSIGTIIKLTSAELKILLEMNDDKIWLTMIPSDHN